MLVMQCNKDRSEVSIFEVCSLILPHSCRSTTISVQFECHCLYSTRCLRSTLCSGFFVTFNYNITGFQYQQGPNVAQPAYSQESYSGQYQEGYPANEYAQNYVSLLSSVRRFCICPRIVWSPHSSAF